MSLMKSVMNFFSLKEEMQPVPNLGRNESCWCGSGRKYKNCHLHEDEKKLKNYAANCMNS
ncbi:MAG TPA: SEC-C metal-binding domain-containing protein [Thermodesulfovibrionales bacterium]|nr:SEC-C metal-binding domain-containing protein [Thermodesulfovibrionales bacterium]